MHFLNHEIGVGRSSTLFHLLFCFLTLYHKLLSIMIMTMRILMLTSACIDLDMNQTPT